MIPRRPYLPPLSRSLSFAIVLLSSCAALGGDRTPVVAVRYDGVEFTGPLLAFTSDTVRIGPNDGTRPPAELSLGDLLSLDFGARASATAPTAVLEFANGDRMAATVRIVQDDLLDAKIGEARLAVPIEALRGISFILPDPEDGTSALFLRDTGADDVVVLTNGDRLTGEFAGLNGTELRLDAAGRETRVPRDRIAALAFSPELTAPATIDGPRQIVQTSHSWITVSGLRRSDDGVWRATTAFGEPIAWPAAAVDRIQLAGDRSTFLSELVPSGVEFTPYLKRRWPLRRDRSVTGEPLAAAGKSRPKGIGMHSRCRVAYTLDGRYSSFRAVVGLAPSAGEIGSAEFSAEVDGREAYRSGPVTAADAEPVLLDLTEAKTLVLSVDYGRNGDVRDRANWCDAILVKK